MLDENSGIKEIDARRLYFHRPYMEEALPI